MGKKLACALGLVLILAIPAGAVGPPRASQAGPAAGDGPRLEIRVVERDGGKPVAGVAIDSLPGRKDRPAFRGTTDDQGRCAVPVPPDEKSHHFAVQAWKDGFVPVRVLWGHDGKFEFEGIPAAYTVLFDRGTPIGGVVRDEQGRPVAGARVAPGSSGSLRGENEYLELPWDASFTTDAQGRWRGDILPAEWEAGEMDLRVEHPRFLSSGRGTYEHRLPDQGSPCPVGRHGAEDRLHPQRDGRRPARQADRRGHGRLAWFRPRTTSSA